MKKILKLFFGRILDRYIDDRVFNYLLNNHKKLFLNEYNTQVWERAVVEKKDKLRKTIPPDLEIFCYTDSILGKLLYTGEFEETEQTFLMRYLREKDIFIDIGANIGLFALIAARKVKTSGRVIAFEPTPVTFERLLENCRINNVTNIECFQIAVSDKSEKLTLYVSNSGYDAWNSFTPESIDPNRSPIPVDTITIDELHKIGLEAQSASLIKIDVEGWEIKVLQGGKNTLSHPMAPHILIEFTDQNAQQAGTSCRELYECLIRFGYKMFTYDPIKNQLVPEMLRSTYPYVNLIASKNPENINIRLSDK